jgi:hypothetical protein
LVAMLPSGGIPARHTEDESAPCLRTRPS